ncbi:hypothetical protein, partial [Leifsonia sp. Root4]
MRTARRSAGRPRPCSS